MAATVRRRPAVAGSGRDLLLQHRVDYQPDALPRQVLWPFYFQLEGAINCWRVLIVKNFNDLNLGIVTWHAAWSFAVATTLVLIAQCYDVSCFLVRYTSCFLAVCFFADQSDSLPASGAGSVGSPFEY